LDGEVDKVSIEKDSIRWAKGIVVGEEHAGGLFGTK